MSKVAGFILGTLWTVTTLIGVGACVKLGEDLYEVAKRDLKKKIKKQK